MLWGVHYITLWAVFSSPCNIASQLNIIAHISNWVKTSGPFLLKGIMLENTSFHAFHSLSGEIPVVNSSVGPNCCTCNCQSTLQAILQELKTMRKLMQLQAGTVTSPLTRGKHWVEDGPACCRAVGWDGLWRPFQIQAVLWFCDLPVR